MNVRHASHAGATPPSRWQGSTRIELYLRLTAEEFAPERDKRREEVLTDILAAHINDAADEKGWE